MAPRVVVVVGTESGYTRMAMNKTIKGWKAGGVDVKQENVLEGSAAPKTAEEFAELAKNFDVIVVATSSFGEGDPPDTLKYFFIALQQAAKAGERPLAGMQHAVLGFGSSMYDTFMNCPRLCDKYLGDCGSRRMVQRAELDEVDEAGGAGDECDQIDLPEYKRWSSDMLKVLTKLPAATKPPCCDWTVPADKIVEIDGAALSSFSSEGAAGPFLAVLAIGVAAGLYFSGSLDGFLGGDEAGEP